MNEEIKKGCVYFFKHVGLNPVKIGYSENESAINRFNQFRTYAPYGAELIGFIQSYEAKELEKLLHKKYKEKRLLGEWFDIDLDDVNKEIKFYSNIEDIKNKNEFQIAWAKEFDKRNKSYECKIELQLEKIRKTSDKIKFIKNKKEINDPKKISELLNISIQMVYKHLKKIN